MKSKKIFLAIHDIDDKFIEEAAPTKISRKKTKPVKRTMRIWRVASVAACAAVIFATMFIIAQHNELPWSSPVPNESNQISTNTPNVKDYPKFTGFVLTAYAAEEKGQILTANFLTDTAPTVLEPDVEILLATYTPAMSSVPGLPFTFDITDDSYAMQISVDKGTLYKWDIQSGVVSECGNTTVCAKGETLYWSPFDVNTNAVENAVIMVTALDNEKAVGKQEIFITSDDFFYSATIGELEVI